MTDGKMETLAIEKAMRTLSTSVLSNGSDPKKKVYPTNFVEPEWNESGETDTTLSSTFVTMEDEEIDCEMVEVLVAQGDPDALQVQAFEQDLSDMFQDVPELHHALISYQEARSKLTEKKKYRGFWPSKGKGKGFGKSFGQRKGGSKGGGKADLLARISRTNCKICGERGHWKAECPRNPDRTTKDAVNFTSQISDSDRPLGEGDLCEARVIVEEWSDGEEEVHHALTAQEVDIQAGFLSGFSQSYPKKPFYHPNSHKPGRSQFPKTVHNSVQKFWESRLIDRNGPSSSMECFVDKGPERTCINEKLQGYAILDTGASRSVIGSDVLPLLLEKLPDRVRNMIKKIPSKVGFRFGNNQITHSFMQIRIPIIRPKQKIWLLIEVVPKATPFLLSIQTMKTLGAQIDLATNQCFLSKLGRSLTLKESKNGLYMINMSELCLGNSEVHHVETLTVEAQDPIVSDLRPPPGLDPCLPECHAESRRSHGHGSLDCRGSHGVVETSTGCFDVTDRDPQSRTRSSSGDRQQCGSTVDRSPHSAEPHRGDCKDLERSREPEAPTDASNEPCTSSESDTIDTNSHGARGVGTGIFTCERRKCVAGNSGILNPSFGKSGSWSPISFTDSDENIQWNQPSNDSSS